jgi:hypothetical protein
MQISPTFREDERSLTGRLGSGMTAIRKFDLSTFGIEPGRFLRELAPSFDHLSWDPYDVKLAHVNLLRHRFPNEADRLNHFLPDYYAGTMGLDAVQDLLLCLSGKERHSLEALRPHRQRSLATFTVTANSRSSPVFKRVPTGTFVQNVGLTDCRSLNRVFGETPLEVTAHPEFGRLLACVVELVNEVAAPRQAARVAFHQVRTVTRWDAPGVVVPEGIHQDGADYIVSALVIEREAVTGGESIVYGPDRQTPYLRTVLEPGQGLFHADSHSPVWHGVTPIRLDPHSGHAEGKRSIFGFDIHLGG